MGLVPRLSLKGSFLEYLNSVTFLFLFTRPHHLGKEACREPHPSDLGWV